MGCKVTYTTVPIRERVPGWLVIVWMRIFIKYALCFTQW